TSMAKKPSAKERERLRPLIEEATVDCYSLGEEYQGFLSVIEENVICPFKAKVLGEDVEVKDVEGGQSGFGLFAVCLYKDKEYRIDVNSLMWGRQKPEGFEWIEAYQEWLRTLD